jgi:ribonuclease HI
MSAVTPHFLLFSESRRGAEHGHWRFVLESLDGADKLEASDIESDVHGERLELLAVVRGLEALPQPSRVTLVTPSRYVDRGLNDGLPEWRSNNWEWEHFGEMAPVKNRDLWQRVDRALEYHQVDCRLRRVDEPAQAGNNAEPLLAGPNYLRRGRIRSQQPAEISNPPGSPLATQEPALGPTANSCYSSEPEVPTISRVKLRKEKSNRSNLACTTRWWRVRLARRFRELLASIRMRMGQFGIGLAPPPWFD